MLNKFKKINWGKVSLYISLTTLFFYIIMLFFNVFFDNIISFYINIKYIFAFSMIAIAFYFSQIINNIPEKKKEKSKSIKTISYLFLTTLIIISINQLFKNILITKYLFEISSVSIMFGFLTIYTNKNEKNTTNKSINFNQKKEIISKNKLINILPIILIFILFIVTRLYSLDYIDSTDNYNDISYKAIYENGNSYYKYSILSTTLSVIIEKIFGWNLYILKLIPISYSTISFFLIYNISKKINKLTAIISIFLFSISPWAIILSKATRDYSFDMMIGLILFIVCAKYYNSTKKFNKNIKLIVLALLKIILFSFFILILCILNSRMQTLVVFIVAIIYIIFILKNIFEYKIQNKNITWFLLTLEFFIIIYFLEFSTFFYGFDVNLFYLKAFFDPSANTSWQWYNENLLHPIFIFSIFLIPLIFIKNNDKVKLLFSIFFIPLIFFSLKFKSHIDYCPTRYLYFIFPYFLIIFSNAFYILIKNFQKNKINLLSFLMIIFLFFNIKNIVYAINPQKYYNDFNKSIIKIDNMGVGRFEVNEVVEYIKSTLKPPSENVAYIFCGRYGEFILLLNLPIEQNRHIITEKGYKYDISKHSFVEANYFNIHELNVAIKNYKNGYYITKEPQIENSQKKNILKLTKHDFIINNTIFTFLKNIGKYKIYQWNN